MSVTSISAQLSKRVQASTDTAMVLGAAWSIASTLVTLDDKVHIDAIPSCLLNNPSRILEIRIRRIAVQHVREFLPVPLL